MAYINDRISAMMGLMFGRVVMGQRLFQKEVPPEEPPVDDTAVEIDVFAATFDPTTAEAVFGRNGQLGGDSEFVIGYTNMPIRYVDGHLIIEDEVETTNQEEETDA